MSYFKDNIETITKENTNYRQVLDTTKTMQLVLMSLKPLEEIGSEVHEHTTQFIRIESGKGRAILNDVPMDLNQDDAIIIPPGTKHNIINVSNDQFLKLYTIYAPPEHDPGCIQKTKNDSEKEYKEYEKYKEYKEYNENKKKYMKIR